MSGKRGAGIAPAIGWAVPALALATGLSAAWADFHGGQESFLTRLDQLTQAGTATPRGSGEPMLIGSMPRSFVIPGTEVSLRVGGQGVGSILWYLKGHATGGALGGTGGYNQTYVDGPGGPGGNLAVIPLNTHTFSNTAAPVGFAHSRSSEWDFSAKQSRIFLDARSPSPHGEVKAYIEFDFSAANTNTILNANNGVTSGYIPRLRSAYASLGGLLVGQTLSTFVDLDAYAETVDIGNTTSQGRARAPQIRYTYPLPYGMSVAAAAENPDSDFASPFGGYLTDTNGLPSANNCAASTQSELTSTPTNAATNITNLCTGTGAFFNAGQNLMPDFVLRGRIEQPWGHIQISAVLRDITLNDGLFVRRSWIGYGGAVSGHFFTWGKDNLVWRGVIGEGIGGYLGNAAGAVATNFGGALVGQSFNATDSRSFLTTNRALYDSAVSGATITAFSGGGAYQHWWTPELRSTVEISMSHSDVSAFYLQASGRNANNKELTIAHVNLIWSPVAFVDLGAEGAWGHRVVISGLKGDSWTFQTSMKFRF